MHEYNRLQKVSGHDILRTISLAQYSCIAINVLRMVKLFGWERKMDEQIDKRREEELLILWKLKVRRLLLLLKIECSDLSSY